MFGAIASAFFLAASVSSRPFHSEFDNDFKIVTDAALMVTFNLSLLLQKDAAQDGLVPRVVLGATLVIVNVVAPLLLVGARGWKWRRDMLSEKRAASAKIYEAPTDLSEVNNPMIGTDEEGGT